MAGLRVCECASFCNSKIKLQEFILAEGYVTRVGLRASQTPYMALKLWLCRCEVWNWQGMEKLVRTLWGVVADIQIKRVEQEGLTSIAR